MLFSMQTLMPRIIKLTRWIYWTEHLLSYGCSWNLAQEMCNTGAPLQEIYVRHANGSPMNTEAERLRVIQCLEAAIERRVSGNTIRCTYLKSYRQNCCSCNLWITLLPISVASGCETWVVYKWQGWPPIGGHPHLPREQPDCHKSRSKHERTNGYQHILCSRFCRRDSWSEDHRFHQASHRPEHSGERPAWAIRTTKERIPHMVPLCQLISTEVSLHSLY